MVEPKSNAEYRAAVGRAITATGSSPAQLLKPVIPESILRSHFLLTFIDNYLEVAITLQ